MSDAPRDPWLGIWIDRCQCIVGRVGDAEPLILLSEIRRLFADLPNAVGIVDQFLLRSLLSQSVSRMIRTHKADQDPGVSRAFFAFTSAGLTAEKWQPEFARLLDRCGAVLGAATSGRASGRLAHVQVDRALGVIDARCSDPGLNLDAVAKDIGFSAFHLSRLLKTHTGHGFVTHLHQRRVSAASRLLTEPHVSIKEVAAAVGYRSVTQLARHVKRFYGSTPAAMRAFSPLAEPRAS